MSSEIIRTKPFIEKVMHGGIANGILEPGDRCRPYVSLRIFLGDNIIHAEAMVDTGADVCGISTELENRLNLEPFGKIYIAGAQSTEPSNVYRLRIGFGDTIIIEDVMTIVYPNFQNSGVEFVIGMPVLKHGDLNIRRDASFTFTI